MKNSLFLLNFIWLGLFGQLNAYASWDDSPNNWENSPHNWENSPHNWENSSMNWNNSPANWNNSSVNMNSSGTYDSYGNRTGYMVEKSNGDINIFSNDGKRAGYIKRK